ncbi:MAG: hypothetical protein AVDCRST_MAG87-2183 [uncultured Thermomicrobiales bacterium]|uniref:Uncharacterized protein n=1 Tax=uncultured Thermomicrobiales bacterium TaxID=1645740 RepID=A0A6J4V5E4_9BACT|nr:MAG: hypothetical protein AVDCRST_MAG87-2183 [uncultured Thermomicrobiales bacterium]
MQHPCHVTQALDPQRAWIARGTRVMSLETPVWAAGDASGAMSRSPWGGQVYCRQCARHGASSWNTMHSRSCR